MPAIFLAVSALVSFVVWATAKRRGVAPEPAPAAAPSKPAGIVSFSSLPIAFVHANQDQTLDAVGLANWSNGGPDLTALDGKTGASLFRLAVPEGQASNATIYADRLDAVLIATPIPALFGIDPKRAKLRFKLGLASRPSDIRFGPGCASVLLETNAVAQIDTLSGAERACTPSEAPMLASTRAAAAASVRISDIAIESSLKSDKALVNPTPPHVALRAVRGRKQLWLRELELGPIETPSGPAALVVATASAAFVLGRAAAPGRNPVCLLLDAETGRTLSSRTLDDPLQAVNRIAAAGDSVFMIGGDGVMRAYRASDCQKLWSAGSGIPR